MSYGKRGWERTAYSLWGRAATSPAPSGPGAVLSAGCPCAPGEAPSPTPPQPQEQSSQARQQGSSQDLQKDAASSPQGDPTPAVSKTLLGSRKSSVIPRTTLRTLRLKAQVSPGEINADCKPPLSTPGLNQRRPTHTKMRSPPQEMAGQEQNEFPFCGNGVTHGLYYGLGSCLPSTEQALS